MNSTHVKASVACYFRYTKQNPLVAFERSVRLSPRNPDVLAVDKQRRLTEIEVKVSMADFRNPTDI